ncbi:farnesyl pyrophosphate synthase 1-like [Harmonia axyridis]|uniref:farnesyl pyrophosphate synthase 1-like n=1 Tax=Harmonia axyridis TaxID=115357 RepID=UPI001E2771E8|nr:farnesyl pyrophosphate synthase 1-like [Harmonia axyridis]
MTSRKVLQVFQSQVNFTRRLSNAAQRCVRNHHDLKFLPEAELAPLMAYFPKFIEDVTHKDMLLGVTKVNKRFERLIKHNLPTGKLLRLHTFIYVYKAIEKHYSNGPLDEEKLNRLYQLSWCLEAHNNTYCMVDDMMDSNDTRRGIPTWATLMGAGTANDALLLEYILMRLLKKYLKGHPNQEKIIDTFLEPHCPISMALELETTNLADFTMDTLKEIAALKMMRHNFNHPIEVATLLADKAYFMNDMIKKALVHMGFLYGIQNDMADCYGNNVTGKRCADIQDKRCGLPIVIALSKANSTQKKILEENYGFKDEVKVEKIKAIFDELDVLDEYYKIEDEYKQKLSDEIEKIQDEFSKDVMWKLANVNTYGELGDSPY